MESSDVLETQQGMRCKARILWQELDCPKPHFQFLSLTVFWREIRSKNEEKEKNRESFAVHTIVALGNEGEKRDGEKRRSFYQADKKIRSKENDLNESVHSIMSGMA
jgi:hypothetical protein